MSKATQLLRSNIVPSILNTVYGGHAKYLPTGNATLDPTPHNKQIRKYKISRVALESVQPAPPKSVSSSDISALNHVRAQLSEQGVRNLECELECSRSSPSEAICFDGKNSRVLHSSGTIIDDQNLLHAGLAGIDFSTPILANPLQRSKLVPPKRVNGTVAVLSGANSHNYYHWLIDIAPKFHFLRNACDEIDHYYIPRKFPYQRQTAALLGIPASKILRVHCETHIVADRVIACGLVGDSATRDTIRILRQHLGREQVGAQLDAVANTDLPVLPPHKMKRVYISRKNARQRRIVNEIELTKLLDQAGFTLIHLEKLSLSKQIAIFANAEIVIGPHGAGLANIAFCYPDTKVVEINTPYRISSLFTRLANAASLEYHLHIAEPVNVKRLDIQSGYGESDMKVNLRCIEDILSRLGL